MWVMIFCGEDGAWTFASAENSDVKRIVWRIDGGGGKLDDRTW